MMTAEEKITSLKQTVESMAADLLTADGQNKALMKENLSLRHKVSLLEDLVVESAAAESEWKRRAKVWYAAYNGHDMPEEKTE